MAAASPRPVNGITRRYCDKQCQRAHWSNHKPYCRPAAAGGARHPATAGITSHPAAAGISAAGLNEEIQRMQAMGLDPNEFLRAAGLQ